MRALTILVPFSLVGVASIADARPMKPEDIVKEVIVETPSISPDGETVVYAASSSDLPLDRRISHIWLAKWDGSGARQLTSRDGESETSPKFSADGRWIGFISNRDGAKRSEDGEGEEARLWLLPTNGGEAQALQGVTGSVEDFAWSPDGRFLALIVDDPEEKPDKDANGEEIPKPIVIDRYHFKMDGTGYLGKQRKRLFLYDLAKKTAQRLADGDYDEYLPAWSPDGTRVAFVSRRGAEPDRGVDSNIYIARVDKPGAAPFQLTTYEGADAPEDALSYPAWSPDGTSIAYVRGGNPTLLWYAASDIAVVPVTGGEPKILTAGQDRNVYTPFWTPEGKAIRFVVENDGRQVLASVSPVGGAVSTVLKGDFTLSFPTQAKNGRVALLETEIAKPAEVFAFDGGKLRQLSDHNSAWLNGIDLASSAYTAFKSKDGTEIHGFVTLPVGAKKGVRLPTMLHPHGGPAAQYSYAFDGWQQIFAGAGYVVLAPNPRGSTGRGTAFSAAINKAWGTVDVEDDLAAVDDAVAKGIADPVKLVVGGWSYGGMSTNYLIASDTRFKAAMAGASIANILAGYGTDQYVVEYDTELGKPWENLDAWLKVSYPFLHNDRIVTPTMFMVGGSDVNVPTLASEQMYQGLRTRGVDTQLVIYPGQYHHFERPSYEIDRMKRWLAWYAKHLK